MQTNAPGPARLLGAIVFPYGLVLIVLTGADLCTGTFMYTTVSALHRRLSWYKMLLHWFITFLGNLAGALFMVSIIFGCKYLSFPSVLIQEPDTPKPLSFSAT